MTRPGSKPTSPDTEGKETVNGIATTRSKVTMMGPDESKFTGHIWLSKEGIPVKVEFTAAEGEGQGVLVELKNLKVGPQASRLFEVPEGYTMSAVPGSGQDGQPVRYEMPKAEYSATLSLNYNNADYRWMGYYAPGKERREIKEPDNRSRIVAIILRDKGLVRELLPDRAIYTERSLKEAAADYPGIEDFKIEYTPLVYNTGGQYMPGMATVTDSRGGRFTGQMFMTKEGFIMSIIATTVDIPPNNPAYGRMTLGAEELKSGHQDPKLFEVPSDYKKVTVEAFNTALNDTGGGNNSGGRDYTSTGRAYTSGRDYTSARSTNPATPSKDSKPGAVDGAVDAAKKIRNLLNW